MSEEHPHHYCLSDHQKSLPDIIGYPLCKDCNGSCCTVPSDSEELEAMVLLEVGEELDPVLATHARIISGYWAIPSTGKPLYECVFLRNNKCSIYEHRPIRCRKYLCDFLLEDDPIMIEWRETHPKK